MTFVNKAMDRVKKQTMVDGPKSGEAVFNVKSSYRSSYGALVLLKAPTTLELSIRCSIDTGQIITGWTQ